MKNYYKALYSIAVDYESFPKKVATRFVSKFRQNTNMAILNQLIENHKYSDAVKYMDEKNIKEIGEYKRIYAYCTQADGRDGASSEMLTYLENSFSVTAGEICDYLSKSIICRREYIEYRYLGGLGNLGFFLIHDDIGEPTYIVKVLDASQKNNEVLFYRYVLNGMNEIKSYIPKCEGIFEYKDKLILLCTKYVKPCKVDSTCDLSAIEVVRLMGEISSKSANQLFKKYNIKVYEGNSEISNLHRTITIHMMLEKELSILKRISGSEELIRCLDEIGTLLLNNKLYKKIQPDVHYVFCHNDFHRKNMFKNETEQITVFDWNNYRIGLYGWDLVYYWGNFETPYCEIQRKFIERQDCIFENKSEMIVWQLLFDFCLVYVWVDRLHGNSSEIYMKEYFLPAINDMKQMISKLA